MQRSDARKRMSDLTPRQLLTEARQAMMAEFKTGIAEYVKANEELHDQIEELHTLAEKAEAERDLLAQAMWDTRTELGFDSDGDTRFHSTDWAEIAKRHAWEAKEVRRDLEEAETLVERTEDERDAAREALDHNVARIEDMRQTLSMAKDRVDEFTYDEFAAVLDDEPLDQWGEVYRSRLGEAREALARVEALVDWHETKAEKARLYRPEVDGENRVMDKTAEVHDDAARRLRAALAQPATDEDAPDE